MDAEDPYDLRLGMGAGRLGGRHRRIVRSAIVAIYLGQPPLAAALEQVTDATVATTETLARKASRAAAGRSRDRRHRQEVMPIRVIGEDRLPCIAARSRDRSRQGNSNRNWRDISGPHDDEVVASSVVGFPYNTRFKTPI